jgi:hypothetical protein
MQFSQVAVSLSVLFAAANALVLPVTEPAVEERGTTPTFYYQEYVLQIKKGLIPFKRLTFLVSHNHPPAVAEFPNGVLSKQLREFSQTIFWEQLLSPLQDWQFEMPLLVCKFQFHYLL